MKSITRIFLLFLIMLVPTVSLAKEFSLSEESVNMVWLVTASAMVFLMQAGFALLESGMSRSKNCINVVMKNYLDVCIGSVVFFLIGYGIMFGNNHTGLFGSSHFAIYKVDGWDYGFLLFQTMFAATAVTITSGALAERTRFTGYLCAAVVITAFIYPIFGSWVWGSFYEGTGWLASLGFIDFAGSTVVHSVGGWCALAGVIVLGPRLGRYDNASKPRDIPGHNLNFVALGGLLLWFGWFGFNGGSTTAADVSIGLINLNTQLAAAGGAIGTLLASKLIAKPILVGNVVNGSLAGLVGITAGCATMEPIFAVVTGFTAGMLALFAVYILMNKGLDDVVGAVSVHGIAGAWGTLCAGLFYSEDMFNTQIVLVQLVGIVACLFWSFGTAFILFYFINKCHLLRVNSIDEQRGLDFSEHDEVAYPEFNADNFYSKDNLQGVER